MRSRHDCHTTGYAVNGVQREFKFWRATPQPPKPVAIELEAAHQLLIEREAKCIALNVRMG